MDDIRAVMDAAGSESAVLWSGQRRARASASCSRRRIPSAARASSSSTRESRDPLATTTRGRRPRRNGASSLPTSAPDGASGATSRTSRGEWAPEVAGDDAFRDWFVWHMRRSLSPGAALTAFRTAMELDVRRRPRRSARARRSSSPRPARPGPGHYVAARIRGAELVELPPLRGHLHVGDDEAHEATMAATARFVARLSAEPSRSASSRRSSSPTSSARPSWRPSSATRPGESCSSGTTPSSVASWPASRVASSTRPATASSPHSTGRREPFLPRRRCATRCATSGSRFGPALHTGECEVSDGKFAGSPCRSAPASRHWPRRERSWSRAP